MNKQTTIKVWLANRCDLERDISVSEIRKAWKVSKWYTTDLPLRRCVLNFLCEYRIEDKSITFNNDLIELLETTQKD